MPRFDLNLLSALDALVNECNVTRAADKLCVTQPTMSGMLQRLRYQFDDQLLVRNGRIMELTPFATSLIGPVREALSSVEALIHTEALFDPATSSRLFSVMASDYCTSLFLPRVIARLAEIAPGIRLSVHALNAPVERMISGEVDLCICPDDWGGIGEEKLQHEHLFSDEFVYLVSQNHPLGSASTLEECLRYPHVGVQMAGVSSTIDAMAIRRVAPGFQPAYSVADFTMVPCLIADTSFVGLVQRRLAENAARHLPVRSFKPPFAVTGVEEALLWHPRHLEELSHRWLRGLLMEERDAWLRYQVNPDAAAQMRLVPNGSARRMAAVGGARLLSVGN